MATGGGDAKIEAHLRKALAGLRTAAKANGAPSGTIELLVASGDGNLTCWSTGATSTPLLARFRGNSPRNTGEIAMRMGFSMPKR